jgi:hypothetical protein
MKFDFNISDKVKIKELNVVGRVKAIYIDSEGLSYSVRYFHNFDLKTVYFLSDELEMVDEFKKKEIGFSLKG